MKKCNLFNTSAIIDKVSSHIVTLRKMPNTNLIEFSVDCVSCLPNEYNEDLTDKITDAYGATVVGTINDLKNDKEIDSIFKDFIDKAYELL